MFVESWSVWLAEAIDADHEVTQEIDVPNDQRTSSKILIPFGRHSSFRARTVVPFAANLEAIDADHEVTQEIDVPNDQGTSSKILIPFGRHSSFRARTVVPFAANLDRKVRGAFIKV